MKSFINMCLLLRIGRSVILTDLKVLALLLLNFIGVIYAQQTAPGIESLPIPLLGEYRSVLDGDWNSAATWQEWMGTEWSPASTFPSESSRITPLVASWNSSTKTGEGNTHEIALPSGIEAGDLLLIFWTGAQAKGGSVGLPSAGGESFTWLYSNPSYWRVAWYKIANGSEGPTTTVRAGTGASAHTAYRIAAGTYDGIPVTIEQPMAGSNSAPDPPILNSGFGAVPTMWIAASHSDGDISTSAPSGYPVPIVAYTGSEGNEGARTATAHIITTNSISQDPAAFNLDSDRNWAANTIAIQGGTRKAVIQNNHTVTLASNLSVFDVDVYGTLNISTDRAMTIHNGSTLIVQDAGRLRLPGHNTASKDARIAGAGSFMLSEGGYLEIGSANGITPTGTATTGSNGINSGNIRVSGIRTFSAGAHYIYNRTGLTNNNQNTGAGYPNNLTGSLTIDNPGTVTKVIGASNERTITTGTLYLVQGVFAAGVSGIIMGNNTFAPNAAIVRTDGMLTGGVSDYSSYQVVYKGRSKATDVELSGARLHSITIDLIDRNQLITLNTNVGIPGVLNLKAGLVNTNSHTLTISNRVTDAVSGGSSDSFVEGNLVRAVSSGANTYNFPLGSGGRYAPVILDFTRNSINRNVTGSTTRSNHTDIASSSLKDPKVERHWTFLASGAGSYTYNPTFSWDYADEEDGFESKRAIVARYSGSAWSYPTISDKTITSVTATQLNDFGEFQIGSEDMAPDASKSNIEADRITNVVANNADVSTITVTVRNANGSPVGAGVDVFLRVTDGSIGNGGLDPSGSWKTNEDGQVLVDLSSTVANSVEVTAYLGTDDEGVLIGGAEINATVRVIFKAGEATHLEIFRQPVGGASGAILPGQPVIHILDANDNIVTDDSATEVTVAILSGDGGTLGGMLSVIADGGVATFSGLTLSAIVGEAYGLTFASDGLREVESDDVTLSSHGSVARMTLSGPITNLPSGNSRLFTVTLKDAAGNTIDTGAESSLEVIFSQIAGLGTISGLNSITAENGIAFITLKGEKAGQVSVNSSIGSPPLADELTFTITVDKSALQIAADATIDLTETDWSVDSWVVLQSAIADAQAVLKDTNSRQSEIDAIRAVLSTAISGLAVDKIALQVAITETEDLIETDWSVDSWVALRAAIEDAQNVLDDIGATQLEVNNLFAALNGALDALEVDKSVLDAVVAESITKVKEDWSTNSWGVFVTALANAEGVLSDAEAIQLEVDIALAELNMAITYLTVDKTALQAVVTETGDLVETHWSADSWIALPLAVSGAQSVLDNTNAKQSEVDVALSDLQDAIAALGVDKAVLRSAVTETEDLIETDWSVDSWTGLQLAISYAQKVLNDTNAKQSEIDAVLDALNIAVGGLIVDKTALQAAVLSAVVRVELDYSPASWGVFATVLASAEGVLTGMEAIQSEIDAILAVLNTAIAELTVDKTALQVSVIETEGLIEADWSIDSWEVLQIAITDAQFVLDNINTKQSEIETVLTALNVAVAGLELVVSTIIGIEDDLPILETVYGTAFEDIDGLKDLPLSLMASLSSGDSELVEVKWEAGNYNPTVLGEYTILGKLVLPADPVFANESDLMAEVKVTVKPKSITIIAMPHNKIYGDDDPEDYEYALDDGSELAEGDKLNDLVSESSRDDGEDAGTYNVLLTFEGAKSSNYEIEFEEENGAFIIFPAPFTVIVDAGLGKVYGAADPALTYTVSGLVNGEKEEDVISGVLKRDVGEDVNSYVISRGDLSAGANYEINFFAGAKFTITPADIEDITFNKGSFVYDGLEKSIQVTGTLPVGTNVSYDANTRTDAGAQKATATISGDNYNELVLKADLEVTKVPLIITPIARTMVYGEAEPSLGYISSPLLVSGNGFSGTLSRAAGEDVGDYLIGLGDLSVGSNYELNLDETEVFLAIIPRFLTVTAEDKTKVYGRGDPALTYMVSSELIGSDAFTGGLTRTAGESVGTYAIGQGTLALNSNYELDFVPGSLRILESEIEGITFQEKTVVYTGSAQRLEVSGLPEEASVTYENNSQTDAGSYTVTATISRPNHGDLVLTAVLTIQKASQHIQFKELGKLLRNVGQVELEVNSDSGLPVSLQSSDELVATIVGKDLLVHRLGTTRITATQEGDKNHEPAELVTITVIVEDATGDDPVRVHQALSPNGDGINDFLILEGVKDYPENKLTILTRNGLRVFSIDGYDNDSRVFKGIGNFNSSGGTLPQGTYFYVLEYKDGGSWKVKKGWFVLKM